MSAYQKINEMITARLIERIEATNTLPWKKPWTSISLMPKNLVTGKNYRGVNVFLLHMLGYASPYFLSMKQVNEMGGKVRKGEKSCPVVFWKILEPKDGKCPKCGFSPVANILYGMPAYDEQMQKEIDAGQLAIGGCCIGIDDPVWECSKCNLLIYRNG